ncbi:NADH-quinone oxidoreductase subunit NuoG [Geothermobacter hydrogeniphilus]|uniref:NADH dehydrogenase (Quinone) subunit G n=1 Tax=Geothermobacter hydrogeniphilus TaxID=1969733 RepID=A0A1X0YAJ3_9BACT|nr:NADH-quinone oxidoreductase subunit NuoG [Geothermobacter hydrogeniphilus]ORJ62137.1 NADH dehydrogenase (quinone) subunit G [Geothermobacter hydrogeniphilus]
MPTLTIDNQTVTVPDGSNVLEAAQQLGIVIPHFCYHEALGAVGSCRLCAMRFEQGPVKGLQMACMVPAQDGMVVSTVDADARELRAAVIEWLMLNHPHDCPVCDEGGECQLQDMTIAGGHGIRRYRGKKRTWINQDLGPFIEQEMNRCIQCYRCVRTYRDYCGGDDFGVMGSRNRVFFGRFKDGKLESPFSGNLADVCPTGVFTDKTCRFRSRSWDLQEAASICPHCSLGCSVIPGARYRELQRVRSGINRQTNGFFICDRGRFGYGHVNHPERPRTPKLQGADAAWPEAQQLARRRLTDIAARVGPEAIAMLGSPRASLESLALLHDWAQQLGGARFCGDPQPGRDRAARQLTALLGSKARSLEDVRRSDCLLLVGSDPLNEAPLLGLAVRQAARRGARVTVIDPRPVELPCDFQQLSTGPESLPSLLEQLVSPAEPEDDLAELRTLLRQAERPILCGGGDLLGETGIRQLAAAADHFETGLFVTLGGPNSYGAALLSGSGPDADQLCEEMMAGKIRALVCLENDPLADGPQRMARALGKLEFLLVLDHAPNRLSRQADVFLPTTTVAEGSGTLVNNEGRMLVFSSVFSPGIPLGTNDDGGHPPRSFFPTTPGGEPRPAWAALALLRGDNQSPEMIRRKLEGRDARFAGLSLLDPDGEGQRVRGGGHPAESRDQSFPHPAPEGSLPLLVVDQLFGSEQLASLSPALDAVRPVPQVLLHPETAAARDLKEGDTIELHTELETFPLQLKLNAAMAPGLLLATRLRGTPLELFAPGSLTPCLVGKGGGNA